ncbi:MAG: TetR family transcriptional regulator [Actinophytocola sp.]|nr:TetR family transcriptional regulator [Actinophytocola sp.]
MNERSSVFPLIRETGRKNEAAILTAALDAFGENGFNGASMRDVATAAGTSLSNLYNYFPSKSHLLAELLRLANDEQLARVRTAVEAAGASPVARMHAAVTAFVGFVVDHTTASRVAISEIRYLSGVNRKEVVAARDSTQGIFEEIVASGVRSGDFRTPYPEDVVRSILSMCAAISTWYDPGGRLSKDALCDRHARYALALLEAGRL